MDQKTRPQYYDGQYLGADDLEAIVRYARTAQGRHALGAHLWGIGIGLDLVERALSGDDVEMVMTPGIAWDGHARTLAAAAPQRIGLDLFAEFQDDTPPAGAQVEVWIVYRELPSSPPGVGFSCPDDQLYGRVVETFRVELRRTPVIDYHAVSIANRSIEAIKAQSAFDTTKAPLFDESIPHQAFPERGDRPRWPIFIGIVRWRKDPGQPGRLIKRTDADRNDARRRRRYLGVVAETIVAADGVLRLRDRANNPDDAVLNFKAPVVAPAGAVNDLVWCEGHLRVVGDARLQAGKLDYRVAGGGDDKIPMYLRRIVVNAAVVKTTLDAFIGPPPFPPGAPPPPPHPQTRFTVSTTDQGGNPKECLTVVTDGRVGINAEEPSNTLEVKGPTGIRYGFGYITGDEGAGWTAFAFNAYTPPGGPWVIPPGHKPAMLMLDDAGGVPQFKFQTNISGNPAAPWETHVIVKGDTGNVGVGTVAPTAKTHVRSANPLQGDIQLFSATADFEYDGGSDKLFVFRDAGGKTAFVGGDVGVGTTAPTAKLHIQTPINGNLQLLAPTADFEYDGGPNGRFVFRDNGGTTAFLGGNIGIGTDTPQVKLQVVGNRVRLGTTAKRIDLRTDGSAVDLHSETHSLYLRSNGPGAANNKVIINPFASDGNVGVGTELPTVKFHVVGDMRLNGNAFLPAGGLWLTSDGQEKEAIKPIRGALKKLLALQGVSFKWREPQRHGAGRQRQHGFVAQEVETIFPEWVKETPWGTKAINATGLDALLVEALRDLSARCDRLDSEIADLRAQLARSLKASAGKAGRSKPARKRKPAPVADEPKK